MAPDKHFDSYAAALSVLSAAVVANGGRRLTVNEYLAYCKAQGVANRLTVMVDPKTRHPLCELPVWFTLLKLVGARMEAPPNKERPRTQWARPKKWTAETARVAYERDHLSSFNFLSIMERFYPRPEALRRVNESKAKMGLPALGVDPPNRATGWEER